ncbi:MAG: hypothetical protein GXO60_09840 [Epsilonproteobacteria bacterium]|nr:hypothetical protein [Campylobacterota bacterium]
MKKIFLLIFVIFYIGCSSSIPKNTEHIESSCEKKVKPKSLLFLEQQYHCKSYQ